MKLLGRGVVGPKHIVGVLSKFGYDLHLWFM
jgi:hypothetical protein